MNPRAPCGAVGLPPLQLAGKGSRAHRLGPLGHPGAHIVGVGPGAPFINVNL